MSHFRKLKHSNCLSIQTNSSSDTILLEQRVIKGYLNVLECQQTPACQHGIKTLK